MTGTFLAAWVKLRRPTLLLGTYGAVAAMAVLFTVLSFVTADSQVATQGPGGGPGGGATVAELATSSGLTQGLTASITLLGIVALCVAAAQMAGEFTLGTLRNLLVREPRRARLFAGYWAAIATFLAGAALVAAVASMIAALVMAPMEGVDTTAWTTSAGLGDAAATVGLVLAAVVGYGTIGVIVGLLLRAPVPAIAVGVAWLLAIEMVLSASIDGISRWLPGQLLSAIASSGTTSVTLAAASVTVLAYLLVAGAGVTALFSRRDVAA